jgi:uncharacterized membrane protein YeiH
METLLLVLDLLGTLVFALSGAMAGVKNRLDVFGVLVLSYAAGNAGGITRGKNCTLAVYKSLTPQIALLAKMRVRVAAKWRGY